MRGCPSIFPTLQYLAVIWYLFCRYMCATHFFSAVNPPVNLSIPCSGCCLRMEISAMERGRSLQENHQSEDTRAATTVQKGTGWETAYGMEMPLIDHCASAFPFWRASLLTIKAAHRGESFSLLLGHKTWTFPASVATWNKMHHLALIQYVDR